MDAKPLKRDESFLAFRKCEHAHTCIELGRSAEINLLKLTRCSLTLILSKMVSLHFDYYKMVMCLWDLLFSGWDLDLSHVLQWDLDRT